MNPRIKSSAMLLLFMFLSAGVSNGYDIATSPLHKRGVGEKSRKLLGFEAVLDYDYAGPNVKHEPRGKKGGGGGRSP